MTRPKKRITNIRKRKFVRELIKTGNQTEAVVRAYPNMKRKTAGQYAGDLLAKEDVKKELEKQMRLNELGPDDIVKHTKELIVKGQNDLPMQTVTPELYGKTLNNLMNIYSKLGENVKYNQSLNINISASTTPELLKKRKEYNNFFDAVIDGEIAK